MDESFPNRNYGIIFNRCMVDRKEVKPENDTLSLLLQGVKLGHRRLVEQAKREDDTLVIMRDGKIVHVRARELT